MSIEQTGRFSIKLAVYNGHTSGYNGDGKRFLVVLLVENMRNEFSGMKKTNDLEGKQDFRYFSWYLPFICLRQFGIFDISSLIRLFFVVLCGAVMPLELAGNEPRLYRPPVDGVPVAGVPIAGVPVDGLPVDELPLDGFLSDEPPFDEFSFDEPPFDEPPPGELPLDGATFATDPFGVLPAASLEFPLVV